jgi:hypothetical protein
MAETVAAVAVVVGVVVVEEPRESRQPIACN